jgi:hypothetical protein
LVAISGNFTTGFCITRTETPATTVALDIPERTPTGFFFPLVNPYTVNPCGDWLERDPPHGGCYVDGKYHLGADLPTGPGRSVYAIADGTVFRINRGISWGKDNVAVLIRHKLADGTEFLALYAHIKTSVAEGSTVTGGVAFGTVGYYSEGSHLHLGIHPAVTEPVITGTIGWGRASNSEFPNTNGFVDAINWINTKSPACSNQSQCSLAGFHEATTCNAISGWAWNKSQSNSPVSVDVFDGNTKLATVTANEFRQDLKDKGIGDGRHGFSFATPSSLKNGQEHSIVIKVANTEFLLSNTQQRFNLVCGAGPTPKISVNLIDRINGSVITFVVAKGSSIKTTLSGLSSRIGEYGIRSFRWIRQTTFPNNPNSAKNGEALTETKTSTLPTFDEYLAEGNHNMTLEVTDEAGRKDTAAVTIVVEGTSSAGPNANLSINGQSCNGSTLNFTVPSGGNVSLSLNASSSTAGTGSSISSYEWRSNGTLISNQSSVTSSFTAATYTISLKVTNSAGLSGTATATVVVTPNTAISPTALIAMAGGALLGSNGSTLNYTVAPGGGILMSFNGSGSQVGTGTITSYEWRSSGSVISNLSAFNYSFGAGSYTITLKVGNSAGLFNSSTATIVVATLPTPQITSVSPNPVTGSNSAQPFAINGSGFTSSSTVTLRDKTTGEVFSNRAISSQTSTQLVINPNFTTAAHSWSVEVINGSLSSGQFTFQVVAPASPPSISSVSPDPVTGSNSAQPFTINGSGFTSSSTVTLRDKTTGEVFSNRAISSQTSTRIVINPVFTTAAHSWSVEVLNGSSSSGQYTFQVIAPATPPSISSVSPDPVTGSNGAQPFTINGSGFTSSSTVTLRDKTTGEVFTNRAISSQTSTRIVINPVFTTAAHSWSVEVLNGSLSSGQYAFQVVAPVTSPSISSVSPNPVTGSNSAQPFTINGSGFTSSSTVTLRDKTTGEVFTNRTISSQTSTKIVINPNFTTAAHTWSVEVLNGSLSSGQFTFLVKAP